MLEIVEKERKSAVLTPSQLPCLARVPSINLTSGCAHGCVYCYARSYSQFPGEKRIVLYTNILDKLRDELTRKRKLPTHVYFSPSTDVFQPIDTVLDMAYACFETLFEQGVGVAFVTKGKIPAHHMALLEAHPTLVRAQIGLLTTDKTLAAIVEPYAAPPIVRLTQMSRLVQAGIKTRIRVAPILPGLTSDKDSLHNLFEAASNAGIVEAVVNVLHLRPAIIHSLRRHLAENGLCERVLNRFDEARPLKVCGGKSSQTPLPVDERIALFEQAKRIALQYAIRTHVCGCMNPDISTEKCDLSGTWPDESQMALC